MRKRIKDFLIGPALERCGIRELFDAVLTTGDIGDRNKSDGALFRLAAEKLGVPAQECVVFEDTLEGIRGARAAGMGAYAVILTQDLDTLVRSRIYRHRFLKGTWLMAEKDAQ